MKSDVISLFLILGTIQYADAVPTGGVTENKRTIIGDWDITHRYGVEVDRTNPARFQCRFASDGKFYRVVNGGWEVRGLFKIDANRIRVTLDLADGETIEVFLIKSLSDGKMVLEKEKGGERFKLEKRK